MKTSGEEERLQLAGHVDRPAAKGRIRRTGVSSVRNLISNSRSLERAASSGLHMNRVEERMLESTQTGKNQVKNLVMEERNQEMHMNRVVGELDRKLDKNLVGMEEGRVVEKLHVLVKNSEEENRVKEDENEIARNHRRNLVVGEPELALGQEGGGEKGGGQASF